MESAILGLKCGSYLPISKMHRGSLIAKQGPLCGGPANWSPATEIGRRSTGERLDDQFITEQVENQIGVGFDSPQPAGELVDHQSGSDVGGVDRGFGGTRSGLGFGLVEQRRGVVLSGHRVGSGEDSHRFAQHAAVAPELATVADGSPDGGAVGDAVDAAEDCFADTQVRAEPGGDLRDGDLGIEGADVVGSGCHLRLADVGLQVALGGDVGLINSVKVDQLDLAGTDGGELDGDLATDGSDADDGGRERHQGGQGDEVLLAFETGCGHWLGFLVEGKGRRSHWSSVISHSGKEADGETNRNYCPSSQSPLHWREDQGRESVLSERDRLAGVRVVTSMTCPGGTSEIAVTPQRIQLQPLVLLIEEPWIVPRVWLDIGEVLLLSHVMVRALKRVRVVDLDAETE